MLIVRDCDTPLDSVQGLLDILEVDVGQVHELSAYDTLDSFQDAQILLLTTLNPDWLMYHTRFLDSHAQATTSWMVVKVKKPGFDPAGKQGEMSRRGKLREHFQGFPMHLIPYDLETDSPQRIADEIRRAPTVQAKKLLLYSTSPCLNEEKDLLKALLQRDLLEWNIETAQSDTNRDVLAATDAQVTVVVARDFEAFYKGMYACPETVHPFFVLTQPDTNVALWQKTMRKTADGVRREWPQRYLEALAKWVGASTDIVAQRTFYISPLYEIWRRDAFVPQGDPRFVMWDDYGLPVRLNTETAEQQANYNKTVAAFLAQFNEGEALIRVLKG